MEHVLLSLKEKRCNRVIKTSLSLLILMKDSSHEPEAAASLSFMGLFFSLFAIGGFFISLTLSEIIKCENSDKVLVPNVYEERNSLWLHDTNNPCPAAHMSSSLSALKTACQSPA